MVDYSFAITCFFAYRMASSKPTHNLFTRNVLCNYFHAWPTHYRRVNPTRWQVSLKMTKSPRTNREHYIALVCYRLTAVGLKVVQALPTTLSDTHSSATTRLVVSSPRAQCLDSSSLHSNESRYCNNKGQLALLDIFQYR